MNKPYLPLASGELTKSQGIFIVLTSLVLSLSMGYQQGWPLMATLGSSAVLGSIYSLPPFRLKRFPLLAALCILVIRGSVVNIGFYLQAKQQVLQHSIPSLMAGLKMYPECGLATIFFAVFGIVIAVMKDVPDVKGDTLHGIPTFSVKLGTRNVFR